MEEEEEKQYQGYLLNFFEEEFLLKEKLDYFPLANFILAIHQKDTFHYPILYLNITLINELP